MNSKSRIFLATHQKALLCLASSSQSRGDSRVIQAEISKIFLDIAHLYIAEVAADESDYWISFVFDTCSALGMCSIRYISHLGFQQKRDYIAATLKSRMDRCSKDPLTSDWICQRICQFSAKVVCTSGTKISSSRQIASIILDFIYILISIDRNISNEEDIFFREIRDKVYMKMGWQKTSVSSVITTDYPSMQAVQGDHPRTGLTRTSVESVLAEIEELIGLDSIKNEVNSLVNSIQVRQLRESAGLPNAEVSNHMVFYGNPGTGKTTIARMLGKLYNILGILSKGHFIETDRSGLVGGYLGQTALKTTEVLKSALGGILFIDEAYSLSPSDNSDQYGQEAIDTVLKYMEDHREDLVIIVAGYEDLIGRFLKSNPGLKSRFNKYFYFEDYSYDQLSEIFISISESSNYQLDIDARKHLNKVTEELIRIKPSNFGNGRTMRNLFERSISNQANRIMQQNVNSRDDLTRLTKEDILWEDILEISR